MDAHQRLAEILAEHTSALKDVVRPTGLGREHEAQPVLLAADRQRSYTPPTITEPDRRRSIGFGLA